MSRIRYWLGLGLRVSASARVARTSKISTLVGMMTSVEVSMSWMSSSGLVRAGVSTIRVL